MLIQRIRIAGYKNVANTNIELKNIVALVGLNNYGKSNILEAIDFGYKFIKETPEVKNKMMGYTNAIPLNIKTANDNFIFEIEYISEFKGREIFVNYEVEFEWLKNKGNDKGNRIVGESLKIKYNEKGQKYASYVNRINNKAFYKSSETGRCDKPILIENDNLIINKISNYDDLFYVDIIKRLTTLRFEINTFLDTTEAFDISPIRFKDIPLYTLDKKTGRNIAETIYNLSINDNELYNLLINSFLSLFPTIEYIKVVSLDIIDKNEGRIKIPENAPFILADKIYRLRVKESTNNQEMYFENLSNGTKRIFLLLTSAILADKSEVSLIAFEELEDCIHPKLFEQLILTLEQLVRHCKIIITSHSPFLIQYLNLQQIYISVPSSDGVAVFRKIRASKQKNISNNALENNMSLGSYIFNMIFKYYEEDDESELLSFIESE